MIGKTVITSCWNALELSRVADFLVFSHLQVVHGRRVEGSGGRDSHRVALARVSEFLAQLIG